jgi:septum formation protein
LKEPHVQKEKDTMEPILLASTSPRRQEILRTLNIPFSVFAPDYNEPVVEGIPPSELAELHAIKKVESVMRIHLQFSAPWILGADTLICLDDKVFGKPKDRDEAKEMLELFSGATHQVITAVCLFDASTKYTSTKTSISTVTFMNLDSEQIDNYLDTGEWQGVAGGYKIQGLASCFISKICGSYSGIVGLPIHELYAILREHGYVFRL